MLRLGGAGGDLAVLDGYPYSFSIQIDSGDRSLIPPNFSLPALPNLDQQIQNLAGCGRSFASGSRPLVLLSPHARSL